MKQPSSFRRFVAHVFVRLLSLVSLWGTVGRGMAQSAPVSQDVAVRLAALEKGFYEALDREAGVTYKSGIETITKGYVGAVDRALTNAMRAGKTDDALALRDEKQSVEKGAAVPKEDTGKEPEALKALRRTYRASKEQLEAARLVKLNPLLDRYLQALAAYSTELTKSGKLDDAAVVRGVAEEIASARANTVTGGFLVHPSGTKKLTGQERSFNNSLGMKFVPVPGTKVMFCIHETRVKDFAAFAATIPGVNDGWKKPQREGVAVGSGSENDSVVMISCEDASAFCAWLSKQEGHTYRLPTDREWSHAVGIAAKESPTELPGSLDGKIRNLYPWGDKLPPPKGCGNLRDESYRAVFKTRINVAENGYDDGFPTTAPVMSFMPNSPGLYDLAGNAWEWCDSWSDNKQTAKVLRGGSWAEGEVLSSRRLSANTAARTWEFGFRCVVEPDK